MFTGFLFALIWQHSAQSAQETKKRGYMKQAQRTAREKHGTDYAGCCVLREKKGRANRLRVHAC